MAELFRIDPKRPQPIQVPAILRSIALIGLAIAAGLFIVSRNTHLGVREVLLLAPVFVILGAFSIFRTIRRERAGILACEWVFGDGFLQRRMPHRPDIEIKKEDIKRIDDISTGLIVHGASLGQVIWIPRSIQDFQKLRSLLADWQEIREPTQKLSSSSVSLLAGLGAVLAFVVTFTSHDPRVVVPLGLFMAGFLLYSLWHIRRSPHVDPRVKRSAWFVLLPAFALLARVILMIEGRIP